MAPSFSFRHSGNRLLESEVRRRPILGLPARDLPLPDSSSHRHCVLVSFHFTFLRVRVWLVQCCNPWDSCG
ncbi:hypothetical protein LINPERPRIM_LOCUS22686 [Linum perenne]